MIKKYSRALNENEKRILNNDIKQIKNRIKRSNKIYFIMSMVILAIGIPLAISQVKRGDKILGYLAFGTLAVYLLIVLWVKIEEKIKSSRSIQNIKTAITNNSVEVLYCQSNKMIKLEEFEDEGPHYLFQVEDNKILSLGGQEFYETESFPNTEFEIIRCYGNETFPIIFKKYNYGEKLKPIRTISGKEKLKLMKSRKYPDPEKFEVIEGRLENIEELLID